MFNWLSWFTDFGNSKIVSLILFVSVFCAIVLYVFTGKQRAKRLESYKNIPFQDEDAETDDHSRKVMDNERKNN